MRFCSALSPIVIRLRQLRSDRAGSVAAMTALTVPVLIGFAALAVDVSIWSSQKNSAQGTADFAALAAQVAATAGSNRVQAEIEAKAVASVNGFTDGLNGITVTVNNPPASGSYTSNNSAYEVIITQPQTLYFAGILGLAPTVTGRAVAVSNSSAPACVLSLDTSAQDAINLSGSASITANGCTVAANSSNAKALNTSGSACVTADKLSLVGSYNNGSGCLNVPTKNTGTTATADPYVSLPNPSISACASSINISGGTATYSSGTYCKITVSGGGSLTLNAGTYYIDSGDLTVSGGSTIIASAGVSIILTSSGSTYGKVTISGGSTVNLTAPSSGTWAGIGLYVDRRSPKHTQTVSGGSAQQITGAIYMPTQAITFSGGSNSGGVCSQLIGLTMNFSGPSNFGKNCSIPVAGLQGGSSGLVE